MYGKTLTLVSSLRIVSYLFLSILIDFNSIFCNVTVGNSSCKR